MSQFLTKMKKSYLILYILVFANLQFLYSQKLSKIENDKTTTSTNTYIVFSIKAVDFENSLHLEDYKTSEFQVENGFTYELNKLFEISLGINAGLVLGIPYEDRLIAYLNSNNSSNNDSFLQNYSQIDYMDQTFAKNRVYIGLHPQLGYTITNNWNLNLGTEYRYFFQPFFQERNNFGNTFYEEGTNYLLLWNTNLSYKLNEKIALGIHYERGISYLRNVSLNSINSTTNKFTVRYHSLGLNLKYCF